MRTAAERIALVADDGSFVPWDEDVVATDPLAFADSRPYAERLAEAREATGVSEAVQTGRATLRGRPVVVVASEFGFLGGSIGTATGERIARAFDRAVDERLPLIALTGSGGTRMQEGSLAVVAMATLAAAARRLRSAGLPYVVYLTDPTTGGVTASWGSLGTVTFAQPGALVGFGGPRVVELLTGSPLPDGVQRAENLLRHGLVDDVVAPGDLRRRIERVLAVAAGDPALAVGDAPVSVGDAAVAVGDAAVAAGDPMAAAGDDAVAELDVDAWTSLQLSRHAGRPAAHDFLAACATDVTEIRGDGGGQDDRACLAALARVRGVPAVVVAQNRDRASATPARMGPAGYRKVCRALRLAEELGLPIVTLVDTPGAEMSVAAEEGGVARAIAYVLADMSSVRSPTLALLLGEGGSGGALALLAADRVLCAQHASLSAIAPEGASAILYRDRSRAPELAAMQAIASTELLRHGIVDGIVDERPSAEREPAEFLARLGDAAEGELRALVAEDPSARLAAREHRYRSIGHVAQGAA